MKFVLPIKSTYVPDWGVWEAVREVVQNAKDEEDQNGHGMSVSFAPPDPSIGDDALGLLTLHNEGASMDRKALLIGHSGKLGSEVARGKFGEGLNLALLAAVRSGRPITIYTPTEKWVPTTEYSSEYGANCLTVTSTKLRRDRTGVTVEIALKPEEWERYRNRFIFLSDINDDEVIHVPGRGSVMLGESRRGHVYVRGIYVDKLAKLECGYDLIDMPLDRDRRMVDVWDLQWRLGIMYREAVSAQPDKLGPRVYEMLRDDSEDTKSLHYHATKELAESVVQAFRAQHGDDAFPVSSISEARDIEHLGRRGIVAPEGLRNAMRPAVGDVHSAKSELRKAIDRSIPWSDLDIVKRANLTNAAQLVDAIRVLDAPVLDRLDVVEFRDRRIEGLFEGSTGRISIALRMLDDPMKLLTVMIHETAHAATLAEDDSVDHVHKIEAIWAKLYFAKTAS